MSPHPPEQSRHPPCCPRCAYDLSGETERWHENCPIAGTCPECGLPLSWREVFAVRDEWDSEVGWYSEHAHSLWAILKRTPGTMLRLVFPSRFFRGVHFRQVVYPKPLLFWVLAVFALLWFFTTVPAGMAQSAEGAWYLHQLAVPPDAHHWFLALRDVLNALSFPYAQWSYYDELGLELGSEALFISPTMTYGLIPFVTVSVFWMITVLVVPVSRRHAIENPKLLLRGVILGMLPVIVLIPVIRSLTAIYVYRGWRYGDEWIIYAEIIVWFVALFWQQCIWTAFVRWGMGVRPSWYINLPGFFVSLIMGFMTTLWFIL